MAGLKKLMALNSSSFDTLIEKATSEENTTEEWSVILTICDRVNAEANGPKECLSAIIKRMSSPIPRVLMQCLTVLDSLVKNCGKRFHLELSSREFERELDRLLTSRTHHKVIDQCKGLIKKWALEFKDDPQLHVIPSMYHRLRIAGYNFPSTEPAKPKVSLAKLSADVVTSNQEEEDIAKAIELSLKETSGKSSKSSAKATTNGATNGSTNLYSSLLDTTPKQTGAKEIGEKEPLKVRALYDFEAAEDNELTFKAGEVIIVIDNSDANWWKGSNHRGEGLFPANFVSTDLNAEFEPSYKAEKKVQFNEEVKVKVLDNEKSEPVKIDESKIDRLLHLLHEADPQSDKADSEELLTLEEQCISMMPLIDQKIESIDKRHAVLSGLNHQLNQALSLYHELVKESNYLEQAQQQLPPSTYAPGGTVPQPYAPAMGFMPANSVAAVPPVPYGTPYQSEYPGPQQQQQQAVPNSNIPISSQANPPPINYAAPMPQYQPQNSYYVNSQVGGGVPANSTNIGVSPLSFPYQSTTPTTSQPVAGGQYGFGSPNDGNAGYNSMQYHQSPQAINQTPPSNVGNSNLL